MLADPFVANKLNPNVKAPFLYELTKRYEKEKPYLGLSILHKLPLTLSTILEIKCLQQGGANVTVSPCNIIKTHTKVLEELANNNINIVNDINKQSSFIYDIHLDCGAELIDFSAPRIGTVELTQTGIEKYKLTKPNYPIISIHDSILKNLETIGTGIGFTEALCLLTNQSIFDKKIIVFGYGKVGKGIVASLKEFTNKIIVVEKNIDIINKTYKDNIEIIPFNEKELITNHLKDTFAIVTATGIRELISNNFDKESFKGIWLANMGASDEFGRKFATEEILYNKIPINFVLDYPTPLAFIDPIFFAVISSIKILTDKQLAPNISRFPDTLAVKIIKDWEQIYQRKIKC